MNFMLHTSEFNLHYWIAFCILIIFLTIVNAFVMPRLFRGIKADIMSTLFWIVSAISYCVFLSHIPTKINHSIHFLTGYLIELSLSVDNVFVFIMIFEKLKISFNHQHKILNIGIVSAIIMRLMMILFAIELIQKFTWIFYVFGLFLVLSAIKMIFAEFFQNKKTDVQPFYIKYFVRSNDTRKIFFTTWHGKKVATVNLLALILIEKADLIFAVDSIPAILSVTQDSFIVFSSNIFAICGLRALFFCISHTAQTYVYLKHGIILILMFIGVKLILMPQGIHVPQSFSLGLIVLIIFCSILLSKMISHDKKIS